VTQQNAAMVEEATAATRTLTQQSTELAQIVSRFTTAASAMIQAEEARESHRPVRPAPARKKMAAAGAAPKMDDAGWEEF
jgi:methyl-accepting chemotaxis protein